MIFRQLTQTYDGCFSLDFISIGCYYRYHNDLTDIADIISYEDAELRIGRR